MSRDQGEHLSHVVPDAACWLRSITSKTWKRRRGWPDVIDLFCLFVENRRDIRQETTSAVPRVTARMTASRKESALAFHRQDPIEGDRAFSQHLLALVRVRSDPSTSRQGERKQSPSSSLY
jgi:hypothetical protein